MGVVARQMRNHLRGNSSFFDDQFFDNAMTDKMYENYINKSFFWIKNIQYIYCDYRDEKTYCEK